MTSSFWICISLIFFSCLALARTSITILQSYGEIVQPGLGLIPDFSGIAFSFSPFNLMLTIDFPLLCSWMCFLPLISPKILRWRVGYCQRLFSASTEMIMWFHCSPCLYGGFCWLIHWITPASLGWSLLDPVGWWFWCVLGISLCIFSVFTFASRIHKRDWSEILFLCSICMV